MHLEPVPKATTENSVERETRHNAQNKRKFLMNSTTLFRWGSHLLDFCGCKESPHILCPRTDSCRCSWEYWRVFPAYRSIYDSTLKHSSIIGDIVEIGFKICWNRFESTEIFLKVGWNLTQYIMYCLFWFICWAIYISTYHGFLLRNIPTELSHSDQDKIPCVFPVYQFSLRH